MKQEIKFGEPDKIVEQRLQWLKQKFPYCTEIKSISPELLLSYEFAIAVSEFIQIGRYKNFDQFFADQRKNGSFSYFETQNPSIPLERLWQLCIDLKTIVRLHQIEIISGVIHTTGITNALTDIKSGYHKPANHFPEAERRNSIRYHIQNLEFFDHNRNPIVDDFVRFQQEHEGFVFYNSTAFPVGLKYKDYALGEIPVVFWSDKRLLAQLPYTQEAGTGMLIGEVRIPGEVSLKYTQAIFTDLRNISKEQSDILRKVAPVYDLEYLVAIKFILEEVMNVWEACDPQAFYRTLLPHGNFSIPKYGTGQQAVQKYIERMTQE